MGARKSSRAVLPLSGRDAPKGVQTMSTTFNETEGFDLSDLTGLMSYNICQIYCNSLKLKRTQAKVAIPQYFEKSSFTTHFTNLLHYLKLNKRSSVADRTHFSFHIDTACVICRGG